MRIKESGLVLISNRRHIVSKLQKKAQCPECKSKNLGCSLYCTDDYESQDMNIYLATAHCNNCQYEWDLSVRRKKPTYKDWCNDCNKKVKTFDCKCTVCDSSDLAEIKKKPEVKFYFSRMEGWYLLPSIIVGRYRLPEDVGANTIGISFTFLCFDFQFEFWWNISDVKRIESVDDVIEMALKIDSAKIEADSATNTDWDQMIKSEHAKIQEAIEKEK